MRDEGILMQLCNSEHIVKCYSIVSLPRYHVIVMEYCDGSNLENYLSTCENNRVSAAEALDILKQLIAGFAVSLTITVGTASPQDYSSRHEVRKCVPSQRNHQNWRFGTFSNHRFYFSWKQYDDGRDTRNHGTRGLPLCVWNQSRHVVAWGYSLSPSSRLFPLLSCQDQNINAKKNHPGWVPDWCGACGGRVPCESDRANADSQARRSDIMVANSQSSADSRSSRCQRA